MNIFKKIMPLVGIACCVLSLSACKTTVYQVLEVSPTNTAIKTDNSVLVYEDDAIKVSYNFWSSYGRIAFSLYNKTQAPLFIDWSKSHLVYNGVSLDYWKDESKVTGLFKMDAASLRQIRNIGRNTMAISMGSTSTKAEVMTTKPLKIMHLPPDSKISIGVFDVSKRPYFDCDFKLKPHSLKNIATKSFTKAASPVVFRNYISYSNDEYFKNTNVIDNEFYVSAAKNMGKKAFRGKKEKIKDCDYKGRRTCDNCPVYPFQQPNSFFIKVIR